MVFKHLGFFDPDSHFIDLALKLHEGLFGARAHNNLFLQLGWFESLSQSTNLFLVDGGVMNFLLLFWETFCNLVVLHLGSFGTFKQFIELSLLGLIGAIVVKECSIGLRRHFPSTDPN